MTAPEPHPRAHRTQTPPYVSPRDVIRIPREVAVCPTCGRYLTAQIEEWTVDDGVPTRGGVSVECSGSDHPDAPETRQPYVYWLEPRERATAYVRTFCRIRREER